MDSTDLVRLSVPCPELDVPITIPLTMVLELKADRLLSEIERVLQYYEQFVLDESLDIEMIHVSLPKGSVGKRCHYVNLPKMITDKRCFIRIGNEDDLCCARALVTVKANSMDMKNEVALDMVDFISFLVVNAIFTNISDISSDQF